MGIQDRLNKRAASFGASHPGITMVLVGLIFGWMVATAVGRLRDALRPADVAYAIAAGIAGMLVNLWWGHIALVRDYRMNRIERVAIPLLTFGSALPMITIFESNVLPAPAEVAALSYAITFLLSGALLLLAGWWRGRQLTPDERLREAARGHAAAFGREPTWAETADLSPLERQLSEMERLLDKYGFDGQADHIRAAAQAYRDDPQAFESMMRSTSMWGGSGAVWEVHLPSYSTKPQDAEVDQQRFQDAVVALVDELDAQGLAPARALQVADGLRSFKTRR